MPKSLTENSRSPPRGNGNLTTGRFFGCTVVPPVQCLLTACPRRLRKGAEEPPRRSAFGCNPFPMVPDAQPPAGEGAQKTQHGPLHPTRASAPDPVGE